MEEKLAKTKRQEQKLAMEEKLAKTKRQEQKLAMEEKLAKTKRQEAVTRIVEDARGEYIIMQKAAVAPGLPLSGETVSTLSPGSSVQVLDVIRVADDARVRAKIEKPAGYISLLNMDDGKRWAIPEAVTRIVDAPGEYIMINSGWVTPGPAKSGEDVAELLPGDSVLVKEVITVAEDARVRVRIAEPGDSSKSWGYTSLLKMDDSGYRWAIPLSFQVKQQQQKKAASTTPAVAHEAHAAALAAVAAFAEKEDVTDAAEATTEEQKGSSSAEAEEATATTEEKSSNDAAETSETEKTSEDEVTPASDAETEE